jgi:dolichol kinase
MFQHVTGSLLREHEHYRMSGATWLLISFLTVVALFDAPIAISAMWAVAVGDASAALIGRMVGRIRIRNSMKTIEGSVACVVMTALGSFLVGGLSVMLSMVAGLFAAAAEWPTWSLDDNIRIGMTVGAGILLCHMAFS